MRGTHYGGRETVGSERGDPPSRFVEGERETGRIDQPRLSVGAWLDPKVQPPVVQDRRGQQPVATPELGGFGAGGDYTNRRHHFDDQMSPSFCDTLVAGLD
jgi:hypothetical protein